MNPAKSMRGTIKRPDTVRAVDINPTRIVVMTICLKSGPADFSPSSGGIKQGRWEIQRVRLIGMQAE